MVDIKLTKVNHLLINMKHSFCNGITPPGYIESLQQELNNVPAELQAMKLEHMYQRVSYLEINSVDHAILPPE
ncbi:unnamed protein product [Cuscuta campestris]|uniref:Uncharacterized protein n=1 Tax=Cuscuta campestris TaxID=132261 RepID=A0A484KD59_9ASTE|nr:unnamed protein product [Cuscuta campestris]